MNFSEEGLDFLLCEGWYTTGHYLSGYKYAGNEGWNFLYQYDKLSKEILERSIVLVLLTSDNPDDLERAAKTPRVKEFVNKPLTSEAYWKVVKGDFG